MSERSEAGFTLIEVLVALAIVVISMAVLLKIIATNLDRTREVRDQTVAISLLQSLIARSESTDALQPGVSQGAYPNGFSWRLRVAPYDDGIDRADWPVDAVTVSATVSWKDGARAQSRTLTALRVVAKASPQ